MIAVRFVWRTGLHQAPFARVRLLGSWDADGRWTDGDWSEHSMSPTLAADGRAAFAALVDLEPDPAGRPFRWGVRLDGPGGADLWGVCTEIGDPDGAERVCRLSLPQTSSGADPVEAVCHLSLAGWLGANKWYRPGASEPGVRFAVWAPNARAVTVVIGHTWRDGDPERRPLTAKPF